VKMYPNPNQLSEVIAFARIAAVDGEASVDLYPVASNNEVSYLAISSTLESDEIITLLADPITQAEQNTIMYKKSALPDMRLVTELKSLTTAQAVDYIETKVTNLASAKAVLKIMARMLIAMRNEIWPNI
jgi:hypothetical protein